MKTTAISANELMLGNWVMFIAHKIPAKISLITDLNEDDGTKSWQHITVYENGKPLDTWDVELQEIEPIPLSAELLEKCGFAKHLDGMMYKWESKDFKEHAENGEAYPHLTMYLRRHLIPDNSYCFAYNNYRSYPFQYLHQLQNLVYLLTGQPLTIEL